MNATGLTQLDMWTFAPSPTAPAKAGVDTTTSPQSMSSSAASPARTSLSLETGMVFEKASVLVYGGNSFGLFARYDPGMSCWKMSPGLPIKTLRQWGHYDRQMRCWLLDRCPKSAMMHAGKLYRLLIPERRTCENDGSAWPTPSADDNLVRNLPADTGHRSHIRLSQTAQYYEAKGDWHTLTANDAVKSGAIEPKPENGLSGQVRWATLQARDYTNPSQPDDGRIQRKIEQGWGVTDLNDQIALQQPDASTTKLNPDWCESLMGFPAGWTDPEAPVPDITADTLLAHDWPAPPGAAPHDHELPRTTGRDAHRRDRIKALGNGVVPQCVLPIALMMKQVLDEEQ